jgi:hypothetical protein
MAVEVIDLGIAGVSPLKPALSVYYTLSARRRKSSRPRSDATAICAQCFPQAGISRLPRWRRGLQAATASRCIEGFSRAGFLSPRRGDQGRRHDGWRRPFCGAYPPVAIASTRVQAYAGSSAAGLLGELRPKLSQHPWLPTDRPSNSYGGANRGLGNRCLVQGAAWTRRYRRGLCLVRGFGRPDFAAYHANLQTSPDLNASIVKKFVTKT